jgi:hypothetical protein
MAREQYKSEKRRKEIARQKKQEEKRLRRQERKKAKEEGEGQLPEGGDPNGEAPAGQPVDEPQKDAGTELESKT